MAKSLAGLVRVGLLIAVGLVFVAVHPSLATAAHGHGGGHGGHGGGGGHFGGGHYGGGHYGGGFGGGGYNGGGHFVHRGGAYYGGRGYGGFYGGYSPWNGYGYRSRGYGWGYGLGYRRSFGWNVGYPYGWCYPNYANYGWGWPSYGTTIYLNARPAVPALRVRAPRVRGLWLVDDAPARDVEPVMVAKAKTSRETIFPIVRESSESARRRAESYVELGDKMFRKGQHHAALAQYKLAATAASNWGLPYYREAVAASAVGRYDEAAALVRRGVQLDPRFARNGFRLDDLYGGRVASKEQHQNALAEAALGAPHDRDLIYLVGALLHFNGQTDRAQKFFAHVVRLGGDATSDAIAAFAPGPVAELAARDERL